MGAKENAHGVSVGNPEIYRPLGTLRHKWENNIKINLGEIE
jgi:hypothetical protein